MLWCDVAQPPRFTFGSVSPLLDQGAALGALDL